MKFKIALKISFLIISIIALKATAQDSLKTSAEVKSLTKYKLYLLGTGFEREQRISHSSSLYFGVALESVVPFRPKQPENASDILRIDHAINVAPVLFVGFKNYYNLAKRAELQKVTQNNSANYFGFEYNLIAPILINNRYTTNYVHSISPVWGFQKNTAKNINLELAIGPSFQTDFNKYRVSLLLRLGLSYLI